MSAAPRLRAPARPVLRLPARSPTPPADVAKALYASGKAVEKVAPLEDHLTATAKAGLHPKQTRVIA